MSGRYCRFAPKRRYVCNYEPEENNRVLPSLPGHEAREPAGLIIKQNKAIINVLNQARNLLVELRDIHSE